MIVESMKVGDLVRHVLQPFGDESVGIIIELVDHIEVPPVAKVLWQDGSVEKQRMVDIEAVKKNNT